MYTRQRRINSLARWLARQMQNATAPSGLCSPSAFVCTFFGNGRHLLPRRVCARVRVRLCTLHPRMRMGYGRRLRDSLHRLAVNFPPSKIDSPLPPLVLVLLLNLPNEGKSLGESFDRQKGIQKRNPGTSRRNEGFHVIWQFDSEEGKRRWRFMARNGR